MELLVRDIGPINSLQLDLYGKLLQIYKKKLLKYEVKVIH